MDRDPREEMPAEGQDELQDRPDDRRAQQKPGIDHRARPFLPPMSHS